MIKRGAASVSDWTDLDDDYSVGEFRKKLFGWKKERGFVVVRKKIREDKASAGRKLIHVPAYTFRVFVANREDSPQEIWRDYNKRSDMEKRITELKNDLATDDFCMKQFYATEAAFRWTRSGRSSFRFMGRLERRNPLLEKIKSYLFPTSPKLAET